MTFSTFVTWAVKSVSVVWKVCTVARSSLRSFTACWNVSVSDLLNASFCAYSTATFLRFLSISIAALTALGATMATGADTRETNSPICGMPLAVLEGPMTGTFARTANGSAANACCDRLGPMIPTTLATLIRFWKALMDVGSSLPPSWNTSLIGRPFTPPCLLKNSSAICAPSTCS